MRFAELLAAASRIAPAEIPAPTSSPEVLSVVQDHRLITPGAVFIARKAEKFDAHEFIAAAVAAGAVGIVAERNVDTTVPLVVVPDTRAVLPAIAAAFHGFPADELRLVGVTGTDGKTTTATMVHWLLSHIVGTPVGLLSTAGVKSGHEPIDLLGRFTTPEATEVQALLRMFRDHGADTAVVETSSHGFALRRLDAVAFEVGIVTNVTPEHLDFHKTMDEYVRAKATIAERSKHMIVNLDDPAAPEFLRRASQSTTYGANAKADVQIIDVRSSQHGVSFALVENDSQAEFTLPLIGAFNAWNAAAAVSAAQRLNANLTLGRAAEIMQNVPPVPGRMEVVQHEPFLAVIDFAHTPPAVKTVLQTLRRHTAGRLIVVLGAAGERDPSKREPLGTIAGTLADIAVFTEEDSRSESTANIIAALTRGAATGTAEVIVCENRTEAITKAISLARPGDCVVFLGKGHETTLERMHEVVPWNERNTVLEALS